MADDIAIKVEGVSKTFRLPHEKTTSIKGAVVNFWRHNRTFEKQQVLDDISFEVKKGEFFGIVGRNGSGKSTLLKMMAGIYSPSKGQIHVNGKLTPFIELGVGFNPELTGRENVYLNGALLGFGRSEMKQMYNEIVAFAELERFMDQKLKNYSSGMQVRLAFSIAIKAESDILLIDEVLAVGDAAFQKKSYDYFMKLKKQKRTVILVTHDMSAARLFCDNGIMVEKGEIIKQGKMESVAQAYQRMFNKEMAQTGAGRARTDDDDRWGTGKVTASGAQIYADKKDIVVKCVFRSHEDISEPVFGLTLYNSRGMNILEGNTLRQKTNTRPLKKGETAEITWRFPNILSTDTYSLTVAVCNHTATEFYDWYNEAASLVISKGNTAGLVDPELTPSGIHYSNPAGSK